MIIEQKCASINRLYLMKLMIWWKRWSDMSSVYEKKEK